LIPRSRTLTFDFPATPSRTPGAHPSSHHTATPFIAPLLAPPRARPARTHSPPPSPRHGAFGNTLSARSPLRQIPASSRTLSATCSPRRVRTQLAHRPRPFRHRLNLPAHPPHRSPLPIAPFWAAAPLTTMIIRPYARCGTDS
ncbi:hypothetical protein B0H19DRAFT_1201247, partial [Mycena capillaripes]